MNNQFDKIFYEWQKYMCQLPVDDLYIDLVRILPLVNTEECIRNSLAKLNSDEKIEGNWNE